MPKIFISHSNQDRQFVEDMLVRVLHAHGIDTWYSKDSIMGAARWEREILQGLRDCDWFLLAMSPRSAASQWVKHEVDWAFSRRPGKIIPIMLDQCDPDDFHLGLAGIQHIDLRGDAAEAVNKLLAIFAIQPNRTSLLKIAIEEFKHALKVGHLARADRIARGFPDSTERYRQIKEQMVEKLRKRNPDGIDKVDARGVDRPIIIIVKVQKTGEELEVEVNNSALVERVAEDLRKELSLAETDGDLPLSYRLVIKRTGAVLYGRKSLHEAGVVDQDVLLLWHETPRTAM